MTTAPTRRERQHAATAEEIRHAARRLMATRGTSELNLRAVAREVAITPSGLYRYYDSRDALLTALLVESYTELGDAAEAAAAALSPGTPSAVTFLAVAHAFRDWAVARPHEYGLLFGTPVPGYEPPPETHDVGLRVPGLLLTLLHTAIERGEVVLSLTDDAVSPDLLPVLQQVCGDKFVGLTPAGAALALSCWATLLGALGAEVFGHYPPEVAGAPRELFALTMARQLRAMGFRDA